MFSIGIGYDLSSSSTSCEILRCSPNIPVGVTTVSLPKTALVVPDIKANDGSSGEVIGADSKLEPSTIDKEMWLIDDFLE